MAVCLFEKIDLPSRFIMTFNSIFIKTDVSDQNIYALFQQNMFFEHYSFEYIRYGYFQSLFFFISIIKMMLFQSWFIITVLEF